MMLMVILILITTVEGGGKETCEEISIPMCKEIGYNFTRLPNQFNHQTQDEVRMVQR
jgi:frizzled protein 5/8